MLYITLRQMEYIVAIAKAGSLTEAAQYLNVSQPALSVAITQVETRQQQKIFIRRKGSPITLTTYGKSYVKSAEKLLTEAARLEDYDAHTFHDLLPITVGCFEDLAPRYLAPILTNLKQHFPELKITPQVENFDNLANNMQNGSIEFALSYDLGLDASFDKTIITTLSPHALIAPDHPLAKTSTLNLANLADTPLVLTDQGLSIQHIIRLFQNHGLLPKVAHRAASLEVMRSLAANGEGIGISYTVPPTNQSYDGKPLKAIPITDPEAKEPIVLVRSALNPLIPPMPAVMESVLASIKDIT